MVAIKPTIGLCKRTAGLEEGNRKPKHPLLAAGLRFWPPTLCFRGKLRSFYLFEGMGSFSLLPVQLSVGKRGVSSTYGWRVEPIQSEELASSEPARTDAAIYSRHLDAEPSWLVRPFFPNGVMHIKSWRGVLVFGLILTAALLVAMFAWAVAAVIGVDLFSVQKLAVGEQALAWGWSAKCLIELGFLFVFSCLFCGVNA